jgi:hypothetical protein
VKSDYFKKFFAEKGKNTLGEEFLRRELISWLSAKNCSPRVFFFEFLSSPRIFFLTHGEELFAKSPRVGSRQRILHSAKVRFRVVVVGTSLGPSLHRPSNGINWAGHGIYFRGQ